MDLIRLVHLFKIRNFALYAIGNTISLTGSWIQRIALAWLVWQVTQSPLWLGLVAASGMLPVVLVAPFAGALADRFSQIKIIAVCQFIAFALVMALYVVYSLDLLSLSAIIFFRVCITAVLSFSQPTRLALIPQLVEPDLLRPAISFGALSFNVARFVGPALAGVLMAWTSFGIAFLVNALSFLAMMVAALMMRIPDHLKQKTTSGGGLTSDMFAGIVYILRHRELSSVFMLYSIVLVAGRPITEMLPAFVDTVFDRGVNGLAILTSAMAIGSLMGGVWSASQNAFGLTRTAIVSGGLNAVSVAVFTWISDFWLAMVVIMLASMFMVIFGVTTQTLIQSSIEQTMRGRVMSLWFIIMRAGPPLGALIMGAATTLLGLSLPFVIAAVICLCACGAAWHRRAFLANRFESPVEALPQRSPV